jgi:RND family efflux transporter MFP subunit
MLKKKKGPKAGQDQPRLGKKTKGLLIGGGVVLLIAAFFAINFINSRGDRGIEVTTAVVAPGPMELSLLADGKVSALESQSFYTVAGTKLEQLNVRIGDTVKKGQSLGRLEKLQLQADYLQTRSALADAEALVAEYKIRAADAPERARIAVAKAEQALERARLDFDVGLQGTKATAIADAQRQLLLAENRLTELKINYDTDKITTQDIDLARERLAAAQESYRAVTWSYTFDNASDIQAVANTKLSIVEAKTNLANLQRKFENQGKAYQIEVQNAEAELARAKIGLDQYLSGGDRLAAQLVFAEAEDALVLARMEAGESVLAANKLTSYQRLAEQRRAEVSRAQVELDKADLVAAFDGVVLSVGGEAGDYLAAGTLVIQIGRPDKLVIKGEVDEAEIGKLKGGEEVFITSSAYLGEEFRGKLTQLGAQAVAKQRSSGETIVVPIEVSVDGKSTKLLPGMSVDLKIITSSRPDVLAVPLTAVMTEGDQYYVWQLADGLPVKTTIRSGASNDDSMEVIEGLAPGDEVITGPFDVIQTLTAETKVKKK